MFLPSPSPLARDLTAVIHRPLLSHSRIGILVETTDGHVLFEHDAHMRMIPASNEKLFTCAFALNRLGFSFRPETEFWKELDGLHVMSYGDPLMSPENLAMIRTKLGLSGTEPVFLKQSYSPMINGDWEWGDLSWRYAARITAFTIDRGGVELWLNKGKPELKPAAYGITIKTAPGKIFSDSYDPFTKTVTLTGPIPEKTERIDALALPDPSATAASLLGGHLAPMEAVPSAKPDLIWWGESLEKTMATCLQISDNTLAENFLLQAAQRQPDGSDAVEADPYGNALAQLDDFLYNTVHISKVESSPDDGSGLSRHTVESPNSIAQILKWSYDQPTRDRWLAMLDHPGGGTMVTRLKGVDFRGKTGSEDMVSSLSGYLTVNGRTYIVSIIQNQYAYSYAQAKGLEDEIIRTIAKDESSGTAFAG